MTTICYLRVSKKDGSQDTTNQKFGVAQYAAKHNLGEVQFIEDAVTSRKNWRQRKIGEVVLSLQAGDVLLAAEATRFARSSLEILEINKEILERGAAFHLIKENMVIGGKAVSEIEKIQQELMLMLLGYFGNLERAFNRARTSETRQRELDEIAKNGFFVTKNGVRRTTVGRPKGKQAEVKLDKHRAKIEEYLAKKIPVSSIAKMIDAHPNTVWDYIKRCNLPYEPIRKGGARSSAGKKGNGKEARA